MDDLDMKTNNKRKPLSENNTPTSQVHNHPSNVMLYIFPRDGKCTLPSRDLQTFSEPVSRISGGEDLKEGCSQEYEMEGKRKYSAARLLNLKTVRELKKMKDKENCQDDCQLAVSEAKEERLSEASSTATSVDAQKATKLEKDAKIKKVKNKNLPNSILSPGLQRLILEPKKKKVRRPPNAFMLFAKEMRHEIRMDHPMDSNRQISVRLGNIWQKLSSEAKAKYYKESKALDNLHKETYPSYVYNPTEARMRKQKKTEERMRGKETMKTSLTPIFQMNTDERARNRAPEVCARNPSQIALQEEMVEDPHSCHDLNSRGGFGNENERFPTHLSMSPLHSPLMYHYPYKAWPAPGRGMPTGCNAPCYQYQGKDSLSPISEEEMHSSSNYSRQPFLPMPIHFPPRPPFYNFHPAVWNPWLMWPGPFYCPPPTPPPSSVECLKNYAQVYSDLSPRSKRNVGTPSSNEPTKRKQLQEPGTDSPPSQDVTPQEQERSFRPLVIDLKSGHEKGKGRITEKKKHG